MPKIYVNSHFVGFATGSFTAQSLVDAIWSLGMRSLSAGSIIVKEGMSHNGMEEEMDGDW